MPLEKPLGSITQGSLSKGLEVRLHADVSVEEMRVGKFLVVHGTRSRFFCMLTDVALGTGSQRILSNPPDPIDSFLQKVLAGTGTYGTIELSPMLMITDDPLRRNFAIGEPIDMPVPVCIDLDRFVERSNGVFGKSGTGKSFLTRLLLAGVVKNKLLLI